VQKLEFDTYLILAVSSVSVFWRYQLFGIWYFWYGIVWYGGFGLSVIPFGIGWYWVLLYVGRGVF